jgi:cyclophilin family peptidyl-prolyl cis-trans isomerase
MIRPLGFLVLSASLALPALAADAAAKKEVPAIQQIDQQISKANVDKSSSAWRTKLPKPQKVAFDPKQTYTAVMETNKGVVKIKLLTDVAPMHVTSFIYLTRLGFFDGLSFHRVIPGFMAQGGDPLGTGAGGPGYDFAGEITAANKHDAPGMLSQANRGPDTDGSQFFLTFVPTPWLDKGHTIFGKVVEGLETLKKLEAAGTPGGKPTEPLRIDKVTIQTS